ncbi:caspase domain-containing protein [Whalleya microplaca]|nr:caspase domain-containing protein [Whalleya microplaca]
MSLQESPKTILILIGIDSHRDGKILLNPEGAPISIPPLRGAVNDVEEIDRHIQNHHYRGKLHVVKLTTSGEPAMLPTRANILNQFSTVTKNINHGDIIHVHYSGHGMRVKSEHPFPTGEYGIDLSVVTYDKFIRSQELNYHLREMSKKGAHVSIMCDCCHAGRFTRGEDNGDEDTIRTVDDIAWTILEESEDDMELEEVGAEVRGWSPMTPKEVWLEATDFDLFAACGLDQESPEDHFEGRWHGVYTASFLAALKDGNQPFTQDHLHRKLSAVLRKNHRVQLPVFSGRGNRYFLMESTWEASEVPPLSVIDHGSENGVEWVDLSEGCMQGLQVGSTFALYPWRKDDYSDRETRPLVQVKAVKNFCCRACYTGPRRLDFEYCVNKLPVRLSPLHYRERSSSLSRAIDTKQRAAYHIGRSETGDYQLLTVADEEIPRFPGSPDIENFLFMLSHLARYTMLQDLANPYKTGLQNSYDITMEGDGSCQWDKSKLQSGERPILQCGKIPITFRNKCSDTLYLSVFGFTSKWGVMQIFPCPDAGEQHAAIESGQDRLMIFGLSIPSYWPTETDHFCRMKLFIVKKGMPFNSVMLRDLENASRGEEEKQKPLEHLLAMLGMPGRDWGKDEADKATPWATLDIEVQVKPKVVIHST